ncbi:MAG: fluoride efflux transporter CrcB [Sulfurovaceae bacterium]|nr:fluoride efflux transporter CrcB [Sulfurovaceae bacterium]
MISLGIFLAVGLGGFFGAIFRFAISSWIQKSLGSLFPFGTLGVNILGSFIIGFLFLYFQHINLSIHQKAMFVTGLLGALTTFSTFSWETLFMIQEGLWGRAIGNIGLNIFLCLGATFLGMIIFKRIYGV